MEAVMADDSQRAKARSTFGSSFFENSKAIPAPKNFAAAQQKTANSRPIPTFKVGGAVKKADGGMPRNRAMPYDRPDSMQRGMANGGLTDVRKSAVMQRAMGDQPNVPMTGMGTQPMKVMNHGGKVMKKAQGGTVKPAPNKSGGKKDAEYGDYVISGRPKMPPPKKAAPRPTMPPKTGDKRDAEYGDYVISKAMGGGVQTSADTARKLATEMGGMKHGGVQKKSLGGVLKKIAPYAAMGLVGAALGKKNPLKAGALGAVGALMMGKKKKPIVPPVAGAGAGAGSSVAAGAGGTPVSGQPGVNKYFVNDTFDTTDKNKFMQVKKGGPVGKYAVGGAGKTRLGMAPIKRAQGGAAKVRKGMMTPKGKITPGVKPHKGIGAF
jgi:hypothetical protein